MNKHLELIKKYLLNELEGEEVSIALFGSMALGAVHEASDVDIAVIPRGKWNTGGNPSLAEHTSYRDKLTLIREKLEEMNIPYTVDLVDFSIVSDDFKTFALKNSIWWKV